QSYSSDGGEHWEQGVLNSLVSSQAAVWLTRIPTTGDLLCVWNQSSAEETTTGYYRSRLTSAISTDSGATWQHFRTMASGPGVKEIDRIVDPEPPGFLESSGVLPKLERILPEGHRTVRHPRVRFIDDMAYLVFDDRWYNQQGKKFKDPWRLRAVPISWFYEG
ncbi:MAG: sialidase family protein, partial [Phycisphaerae bacterium]|nr:sialidase family protein [Phycisphaerae bacterium]